MIQNFNKGYPPSFFKPKPHVFISVFHADNSFKIYNQNIRALLNKKNSWIQIKFGTLEQLPRWISGCAEYVSSNMQH